MLKHDLKTLTLVVTILVIINALWLPAIFMIFAFEPQLAADDGASAATVMGVGYLVKFATMILFARWIWAAGDNLRVAGHSDLDFTPASRIWWFAVPIANLFKPFQGMRELWNASQGDTDYSASSGLVASWWALWLANSLFAQFVLGFGLIGSVLDALASVALAGVAIKMIRDIVAAQHTYVGSGDLEEVFA